MDIWDPNWYGDIGGAELLFDGDRPYIDPWFDLRVSLDPWLFVVKLWLELRVNLEPMLDLLWASKLSNGLRNVLLPVVLTMTKQTIKEYCIILGVPTMYFMFVDGQWVFFLMGTHIGFNQFLGVDSQRKWKFGSQVSIESLRSKMVRGLKWEIVNLESEVSNES